MIKSCVAQHAFLSQFFFKWGTGSSVWWGYFFWKQYFLSYLVAFLLKGQVTYSQMSKVHHHMTLTRICGWDCVSFKFYSYPLQKSRTLMINLCAPVTKLQPSTYWSDKGTHRWSVSYVIFETCHWWLRHQLRNRVLVNILKTTLWSWSMWLSKWWCDFNIRILETLIFKEYVSMNHFERSLGNPSHITCRTHEYIDGQWSW